MINVLVCHECERAQPQCVYMYISAAIEVIEKTKQMWQIGCSEQKHYHHHSYTKHKHKLIFGRISFYHILLSDISLTLLFSLSLFLQSLFVSAVYFVCLDLMSFKLCHLV